MDESAAATPVAFLAAGTLFTLTLSSLMATVDDYQPHLSENISDDAARKLINVYVRPYGATRTVSGPDSASNPTDNGAAQLPVVGEAPGNQTAVSSATSSTSQSVTFSWTGEGCSGSKDKHCRATAGCDNGNLDKNHKECAASVSASPSPSPPPANTTPPEFVGPRLPGNDTGNNTGDGNTTAGEDEPSPEPDPDGNNLLAGLSKSPGVLNSTKVNALIAGMNMTNVTDGKTSYFEAKNELGKKDPMYKSVDFRLVFTKIRGPGANGILKDFGDPRSGTDMSTASALFCWDTCATTVRVDATVVR